MINELKSYGRCPSCGRFLKRGLVNFMQHSTLECPEVEIIIFAEKHTAIMKRKYICNKHLNIQNGRKETTPDRNSRMED